MKGIMSQFQVEGQCLSILRNESLQEIGQTFGGGWKAKRRTSLAKALKLKKR